MSKHSWLTKPSHVKADRLIRYFKKAIEIGVSPARARLFAGYYLEQRLQGSISRITRARLVNSVGSEYFGYSRSLSISMIRLFVSLETTGWRVERGLNAKNHQMTFERHLPLMLLPWCERFSMKEDTPAYMLADLCEEQGLLDDAILLRTLVKE